MLHDYIECWRIRHINDMLSFYLLMINVFLFANISLLIIIEIYGDELEYRSLLFVFCVLLRNVMCNFLC
jgi:hypothetical protein